MSNWRYAVAREVMYIELGRYLLTLGQNFLMAAAAIKILWPGVRLWWIVVCSPMALVTLNLIGRAYRRWGWQQQLGSVPTLENMSWMQYIWTTWMDRIREKVGVPRDNIPPPSKMDPELRELMMRGYHQ